MSTLGLYFRGLDQSEANSLRSRLNNLAAEFGYTAAAGPTAGQGNAAALLMAVDAGEVALVLLADEQRDLVLKFLAGHVTGQGALAEALRAVFGGIDAAVQRERAADWREIEGWSE